MTVVLWILYIVICITLILVILLQAGKGADMGAIFGGGGANTVFGASGGQTFMSKMTTVLAVSFMTLCIILAVLSSRSSSVTERGAQPAAPVPAESPVPAEGAAGDTQPAATEEPAAPGENPAATAPAAEVPGKAPESGGTPGDNPS